MLLNISYLTLPPALIFCNFSNFNLYLIADYLFNNLSKDSVFSSYFISLCVHLVGYFVLVSDLISSNVIDLSLTLL